MKKRKRQNQKNTYSLDNNKLFPIIISALFSPSASDNSEAQNLINKCLDKVHVQTLPTPLLSLLPALLNSKCDEIVCKTLDVIGKASLASFEMNEMIALENDVVVSIISLLRHSNTSIQVAACSAILDLLTTFTGRHQLLQFNALQSLIDCFVQAPNLSSRVVSQLTKQKRCGSYPNLNFEMDEACVSLLHAVITLVNACTIQQLQEIQKVIPGYFLVFLKDAWEQVHDKMLCAFSMIHNQDEQSCISNVKVNDLAETIFRLSIHNSKLRGPSHFNKFEKGIFCKSEINFKQFLLNYWEETPLHIKDPMKAVKEDAIFSSFLQAFRSKDAVPSCLPSILKTFTSCPPIASDELDVLHFIKEARNSLGFPLIYQQDIRVLKAQSSEKELHYFGGQTESKCSQESQYLGMGDITKCGEAYMDGYTIALRGMEFRFTSIAADAEELATLFGQPSTGVNMYLTPPNAQGLGCHSDDHCVFVCQVVGSKQWTIFPRTNVQLPRLYDPVDIKHYSEVNQDGKQFLLREGDILYIPRGFPHKAQTITASDGKETDDFSLHMTLGIEVERPFEWEGFFHVALHHWELNLKVSGNISSNLHHTVVKLMHVAIKLLADLDPTFRKACLSGAMSSSSHPEEWLDRHQKTIFIDLVNRISNELSFENAMEHVLTSFSKSEDPFQEISWLNNFVRDGEVSEDEFSHNSLLNPHDYFHLLNQQQKDEIGLTFAQVKSAFCSEVVYEDAQQVYKGLLQKYRTVRKQYTNGMLSLHCTGDDKH